MSFKDVIIVFLAVFAFAVAAPAYEPTESLSDWGGRYSVDVTSASSGIIDSPIEVPIIATEKISAGNRDDCFCNEVEDKKFCGSDGVEYHSKCKFDCAKQLNPFLRRRPCVGITIPQYESDIILLV